MEITKRIYLDRIKSNLSAFHGKIMLMVKANAYGHGAIAVASALDSAVSFFGVATVEEGRKLRENGVKTPILCADVLPFEYSTAKRFDLSIAVGDRKSLEYFVGLGACDRPKIHLKLNTGMNRFGFKITDFEDACSLACNGGVEVEGVYTHLYAPNEKQLDDFDNSIKGIKKVFPNVIVHACSTSSVKLNRYDMLRVGLGAYENTCEVESVVLNSLRVQKGERIGYGDNFATHDGYAVWILGGYADGIVKCEPVILGGMKLNAVSVCMDVFAVLSPRPFERGEIATIVGDGLSENDVAEETNRKIYEVMTAFNGRVKYEYEESGSTKNCENEFSQND